MVWGIRDFGDGDGDGKSLEKRDFGGGRGGLDGIEGGWCEKDGGFGEVFWWRGGGVWFWKEKFVDESEIMMRKLLYNYRIGKRSINVLIKNLINRKIIYLI